MLESGSLFDLPDDPEFDGHTYDPEYDKERLKTQLGRVYHWLQAGEWRTLRELAALTGGSEAGVSARLRDLRKEKFGSYTIERRRKGEPDSGVWEYRLEVKR